MNNYDTVIVGGGSAGIAGAVALGRSRRKVLVLDAGSPRNAPAHHAHNLLGQEGINPQQLLARGRAEAEAYGVVFIDDLVTSLTGSLTDGFTVQTATSSYTARRILLATGLRDQLPDIPGVDRGWGTSVLHCPYCHGWEVRDQRISVIGLGPLSAHQALLFRQLSEHVSYINHEPQALTSDQRDMLTALNIPVIEQPVDHLEFSGETLQGVALANGAIHPTSAVVVASGLQANASLYTQLGGRLTEHPMGYFVKVNDMGATEIPGVYSAGNTSNLSAMVMAAAASGTMAGAAINADLVSTDAAARVAELMRRS